MNNIEDFQDIWQQAPISPTATSELQRMTKTSNHPVLQRLKVKMICEILGLTAFLVLFHDGFDGAEKPFYANVFLVSAAVLFILNDLLVYIFLLNSV